MRKYILIPEYRPLFAMARCYGKTHGPLDRPTPVPIDIIGGLLSQRGQDKLTVYETKILPNGSSAPPVQLTLENYKLPYEEIVGKPAEENHAEPTLVTMEPEVQEPEVVTPTLVEDEPAENPTPVTDPMEVESEGTQEENTPEEAKPETNNVLIIEDHTAISDEAFVTGMSTEEDLKAESEKTITESATVTTAVESAPVQQPRMTKAERKAARRAAEAQKNNQ